jgi:hypothetical protein
MIFFNNIKCFIFFKVFLCALIVFGFTACTTQDLYQAVKENRLHECDKRQGARKAECIAQFSLAYEEYAEEREKIEK